MVAAVWWAEGFAPYITCKDVELIHMTMSFHQSIIEQSLANRSTRHIACAAKRKHP
jgi:hypothetical protein